MEARGERSVSAGGDIGVAVTGDHNVVTLGPAVRSAYREQMRRIAPPELMDRAAELADLAAFCTTDSGPAYAWWRADAWAGKTAQMSWFAPHPPAGARIVPFFVTARLGVQNDVTAYVDVVLEQLAEPAGEGLPAHLTEATREAHLLHLYGAAATACERRRARGCASWSPAASTPRFRVTWRRTTCCATPQSCTGSRPRGTPRRSAPRRNAN